MTHALNHTARPAPCAHPEVPLTSTRSAWSAVGSMTMCVALLIASEFMPVSLLTPIANELGASEGLTGQAISISGLFAVLTSLLIATASGRLDRRHVLIGLTATMLASLALIAAAPSFAMLMMARALLGIAVGGFWSLATATILRIVPADAVPRALGVMYMGNAAATAFAAPLGSALGGLIGWRGVFWALVPLAAATVVWQWVSLPAMPARQRIPVGRVLVLLRRPSVARAMTAVMLSFGGAFAAFTYFRPLFENRVHVTLPQLSLLLLALGSAGFVGTWAAGALLKNHLYRLLRLLPLGLGAVTVAMLLAGQQLWVLGLLMFAWGALNSAMPLSWFTWLTQGIQDEPEAGGGLMVAAVQMAIMLGAGVGGLLLDHVSIIATMVGSAALLALGALAVGSGRRLQPV